MPPVTPTMFRLPVVLVGPGRTLMISVMLMVTQVLKLTLERVVSSRTFAAAGTS